jgi:hypothetical protein
MEPRDQARIDDLACGACREPVTHREARILASRDDLIFVDFQCLACGSLTLGFVFAADAVDLSSTNGRPSRRPIQVGEVVDMRQHLAGWRGDLRSLLRGEAPLAGSGG